MSIRLRETPFNPSARIYASFTSSSLFASCSFSGVTDILYTAGLLFLSHEDFENNTNEYKLNHNGNQLLKYGLKKDVQIPTEYKVKRLSVVTDDDIDEIMDEKIEEAKPKWEGKDGDVIDEDFAQAERDRSRGK